MDIPRVAIWIGLGIVAYLLVMAWNEDYHQKPIADEERASEIASGADPMSSSEARRNDTETAPAATDEFDLPDSGQAMEQGTRESGNGDIDVPDTDSDRIRVQTDVLDLRISLKGGQITHAWLPEHKRTLESDEPLKLLSSGPDLTYILESSLIGRDGPDASGDVPTYRADAANYRLQKGENDLIVDLKYATDQGLSITKRYRFERDRYRIEVSYRVHNRSNESWAGNFSGKIVRDGSGDPTGQRILGVRAFLGMVLSTPEDPYTKYDLDDLQSTPVNRTVEGGWIAFLQHYFMTSWIPDQETTHRYQTRRRDDLYVMGFVSPTTRVAPGEQAELGSSIYIGPKIMDRLQDTAPHLDRTVDFGWLFFISQPLFYILDWFHSLVGNWGVAIILLTVLVKLAFYKLSATSYRSMANMRRVAPELQRIKELHGDDKQKLSQEMMNLYKKEKINPLGGCLPILVQMPVFIALYWVLFESVQLRHAPFMLWIEDLSVMDPYLILPVLMGGSMFLQMQLNPTPPDPVQAKVMKVLPIMFTFFFLWFPAGLVLYWLSNNILSMAQQFYIYRQIDREQAKPAKKS